MLIDLVISSPVRIVFMFVFVIIFDMYHFGKNPIVGGIPASDDMFISDSHDIHLFSLIFLFVFIFVFFTIHIAVATGIQYIIMNLSVVFVPICVDVMIHLMLNTDDRPIIFFVFVVVYCLIDPTIADMITPVVVIFLVFIDMINAGAIFCHVIRTVRFFSLIFSVISMNHVCSGAAAIFIMIAIVNTAFDVSLSSIIVDANMIADAVDCTRKYFIGLSLLFFFVVSILENAIVFISSEIHTISHEFDVRHVTVLVVIRVVFIGCVFIGFFLFYFYFSFVFLYLGFFPFVA